MIATMSPASSDTRYAASRVGRDAGEYPRWFRGDGPQASDL